MRLVGDKYQARVKAAYLGSFENPEDAALAVNDYIIRKGLAMPLNKLSPVHAAANRARRRLAIQEKLLKTPRNYKQGPEAKIMEDIIQMLRGRGWVCRHLHGNMYQVGFPDLYACRKGVQRFIEVKNPKSWKFEESQREFFKELHDQGVGVWILFGATDEEYKKLFQKANFPLYGGLPLS